jgi:hypothetical protein
VCPNERTHASLCICRFWTQANRSLRLSTSRSSMSLPQGPTWLARSTADTREASVALLLLTAHFTLQSRRKSTSGSCGTFPLEAAAPSTQPHRFQPLAKQHRVNMHSSVVVKIRALICAYFLVRVRGCANNRTCCFAKHSYTILIERCYEYQPHDPSSAEQPRIGVHTTVRITHFL